MRLGTMAVAALAAAASMAGAAINSLSGNEPSYDVQAAKRMVRDQGRGRFKRWKQAPWGKRPRYKGTRWAKRATRRGGNPAAHG